MRTLDNKDLELCRQYLILADIPWTSVKVEEEYGMQYYVYIKDGYISFTFSTDSWKKNASEYVSIFFSSTTEDLRYNKKVMNVWLDGKNYGLPEMIKCKNSPHNRTRIVNALREAYHVKFVPFADALNKVNEQYGKVLNVKQEFFNKVKDLSIVSSSRYLPECGSGEEFTLFLKDGKVHKPYDTKCELTIDLPYDQMEQVLTFIDEMKAKAKVSR